MASKTILLLGLSFATVLLIGSEVAARDLAQGAATSTHVTDNKSKGAMVENQNAVNGQLPPSYEVYPGSGYKNGPSGGYGAPGGYGGARCTYGYCGNRCCPYAAEAEAQAQAQAKPQN